MIGMVERLGATAALAAPPITPPVLSPLPSALIQSFSLSDKD